MPRWIPPALKKSKKKGESKGARTVRFVDMGGDDVKNPLVSNRPFSESPLDARVKSRSDESISEVSNCSSELQADHHDLSEVDEEERVCLRHLDELGHALENTFKEVESIDAYVSRLRSDFDHDRVKEHRYMTCMCSAKIAREACCKRQLETWRELQHGMQDLLCNYCQHHHHHQLSPRTLNRNLDSGSTCSEEEVNEVLGHLRRMSTFDHVVQLLNPGGDQKSFVQQWVISGSP